MLWFCRLAESLKVAMLSGHLVRHVAQHAGFYCGALQRCCFSLSSVASQIHSSLHQFTDDESLMRDTGTHFKYRSMDYRNCHNSTASCPAWLTIWSTAVGKLVLMLLGAQFTKNLMPDLCQVYELQAICKNIS